MTNFLFILVSHQTSTFSEHGSLRMTSGAIHATVPANDILILLSVHSRLVPKSEIFTMSLRAISTLQHNRNTCCNNFCNSYCNFTCNTHRNTRCSHSSATIKAAITATTAEILTATSSATPTEASSTLCLKKRHPFYSCDIFVRFHPILLIFGRNRP